MSDTSSAPSLPRLLAVVRRNPHYRRLFLANAVSQLGDWFNIVALYSLLVELTGRGESVSFALVARTLPMFLAGPLAGVAADRLDRRAIMVLSDVLRAGLVACLLLVRSPDRAWLAYAVVTLHALVSAFFDPAQLATFPALVVEEDLVVASAMENTLWATTLAVGSAAGGVVMAALGRDAAFAIDALSFVGSALLLRTLPPTPRRPPTLPPPSGGALDRWARLLGLHDFAEGVRYLAGHARVRALILVKGGFGLTLGGVLVLLAYFGERVFGAGAAGVAWLWTARGVGSFVGPLLAWRLGGDAPPALRRGITVAYAGICLSYLAFASASGLGWAALALAVANAGGSVLWTYASSLQQMLVPDRVRGRVFAADMGFMTLTMTCSTLAVGALLDRGLGPRALMAGCGLCALLPIAYWLAAQRHFREG